MDWSVDKIATKLSSFVNDIGRDHARLVDYMLEEAEKMAPQRRHLSAFDDFAEMKPKTIDPNEPLEPPELLEPREADAEEPEPEPEPVTMTVKFKASFSSHSHLGNSLTPETAA